MYILDTDHLGILQRQTGTEFTLLAQRLSQHEQQAFYTTIVSYHEQVLGWTAYLSKAHDQPQIVRGYEMLELLLAAFARAQVLPFDSAAGNEFHRLRQQGVRIGTMEVRIACIAIVNRMTVLTRNSVDFDKVPGLLIEDWTSTI